MGQEAAVVGGGTPKTHRADYFGGDIPWITPADLSGYKQKYISAGARNITQAGLDNSGAKLMPADTVLFSSRAPIGYVAIAANPVSTNQGFKSFVLKDSLTPDFVYYYLQHAKKLALELASGTTFQEISGKNAARIPLPVPPLSTQKQIVAEIEKQFPRLDAGVAALRRVQANLKRYRAAILKAACEGRLVPTEAELAKAEGRSFETGEQLLARIVADRRKNWHGRGKYKEPATPDTTNLPPLPEGWAWATIEQITDNFDGRRVPLKAADRDKRPGQYPYYGASGIIDDIDDFLFDGDFLLVAEDGANLLARSTPVAFEASGRFWVNNHAHILQTLGRIPLAYLAIFLNGTDISLSVTGTAQPKLTQAAMNRILVPIPPLTEQTRIVAEVERRLSVIEELEAAVAVNFQRATRLRQSILQRAFVGREP